MAAKAYNTSDTPLVLDDGSVLAGREHGEVDTDSDRVLDAVAAGTLVLTHPATHDRTVRRAADRAAERAAADAVWAAAGLNPGVPADADPDDDEDPDYARSNAELTDNANTPKGA